jgi:hypothetical protein
MRCWRAAGSRKETWRARGLHAEAGGSLLGLLVRLGLVSERDQAQASAEVLGLPLLEGKQLPEARRRRWPRLPLSLRFLKQFHVCPLALDEQGCGCGWPMPTTPIRSRPCSWRWGTGDPGAGHARGDR